MVPLLIDEVEVTVPEGTKILDAAVRAGIYIPHVEDRMFSKRESEMLQHYIVEYGKMPKTNQEMEDLF